MILKSQFFVRNKGLEIYLESSFNGTFEVISKGSASMQFVSC